MDLWLAVKDGDHVRLENLLKNGAKVNCVDEKGAGLLHQAVNCGRERIVKVLLKKGVDALQVTRDKGNTALHIAVVKNNASVVAALLDNVSRETLPKLLDARTKRTGSTALHVAAKTHCYEIAKMLLANGSIFNATDKEGKRPVDFAKDEWLEVLLNAIEVNFTLVEFDEPQLYVRLIDQPLDEYLCMNNCRDGQGRTLFQVALKENREDTVKILIGMRCDRSSHFPHADMLALNELASSFENYIVASKELLKKIMENRFDPSVALRQGYYFMNELRKLIESLRNYTRKISKSLRILNIQSLEEALEFFERHVDYRKLLRANLGVDVFIRSSLLAIIFPVGMIFQQITISKLIAALKINDFAGVERCLANRVNVDARGESDGRTPLHLAAFYGYADLAKLLLDWHASLTSVDVSGNMPLHIAASNGHVKIVEMLLEKNVEMVDVRGTSSEFTALHLATGAGCLDVVKCLLKHGASYRLRSRSGKMPVHMARDHEVLTFFELMEGLFEMAADGDEKITSKLKKLKNDELMAVANARDEMGYNLLQSAIIRNHKAVASRIARMIKNKMEKKKL